MSAGVVSVVTRTAGTSAAASSRARRLDSAIRPVAAPGDAASPRTSSGSSPASRSCACSSSCTICGWIEATARARSIVPAAARSTVSRVAARGPGRSAGHALRSASLPSRSSKPTRATAWRWCSRVVRAWRSRSVPPGNADSSSPLPAERGTLRRTPRKNVPDGASRPVSGSRLSAVPCPDLSQGPIRSACRCSARPRSAGSDWDLRARLPRGTPTGRAPRSRPGRPAQRGRLEPGWCPCGSRGPIALSPARARR